MIGREQSPEIGKNTQFKKGKSGNPNGAKKGVPHSKTRLRRLLELTENLTNPITKEVEGFSVAEQMDLAMIIKARSGDVKAYTAVLDRLEGKPKQTIENEIDGKLNISLVEFIGDDDEQTKD